MKRHYLIKLCAQFITCFSSFHMNIISDTISWRITESYMHKCRNPCVIFNKPKLNCLIYLIQCIKTIKNTCNIFKYISYTLSLGFYLKFCSDGCSVKCLFLIITKMCFALQYEFYFPCISDIMRRLTWVKL